MPKCIFDQATGLFAGGSRYDEATYNPSTQVQITLPYFPDPRTERWDGANGVRPATQQEIDDYDTAQRESIVDNALMLAGASILEAVHDIAHEQAKFALLYQFIKSPAAYATQGAFLNALQSATAFPTDTELKQLAKQNYLDKLV